MAAMCRRGGRALRAGSSGAVSVVRRGGGGIGSRLKPLVQRGQRALAESIVDLDSASNVGTRGKSGS